ncbi:MAG: hypothetical protein Q8Q09_25770 [Deltaproteobacteria bacterium]|nr:hypothetical protein [Deltaproteobacteria bacterium]
MKRFSERTSWEGGRSSVLFSAAALEASGHHASLATTLNTQLTKWATLDGQRKSADDAITRAHAQVAWADYALDQAVRAFANELLRDAGGKSQDKTYRAFFTDNPSEIVRMALEREIERLEAMWLVATRVKISKRATEALNGLRACCEEGTKRLVARKAAQDHRALVALDIAAWKSSTDAARVSAHVQLQQWALDHDDEPSYAERFFADTEPSPKRKSEPPPPDAK